jgi:hypothetical protein
VTYLALADILKGVGMLFPSEDRVTCEIQAFTSVYFEIASFMWVGVICYVMFNVVVKKDFYCQRKELCFILICNVIPLTGALLPVFFNNYGYAQGWCFIDDSGDGFVVATVLRAVVFYIPLMVVLAYCAYTYTRVYRELSCYSKNTLDITYEDRRAVLYKLYLYPLVLVVSFAPVTVYRVTNFSNDHDSGNFALALTSAILMSLNGLMNAVVYGMTKHVRQTVLASCRGRTGQETDLFNFSSLSN